MPSDSSDSTPMSLRAFNSMFSWLICASSSFFLASRSAYSRAKNAAFAFAASVVPKKPCFHSSTFANQADRPEASEACSKAGSLWGRGGYFPIVSPFQEHPEVLQQFWHL